MEDQACVDFQFEQLSPAANLDEVWERFDPARSVDPRAEAYIPRTDPELQKLSFELKRSSHHIHAFLCGHRGSGKTTELSRLCLDPGITGKYLTLYLTAKNFGSETVHLSHDAVLVEMGLKMIHAGKDHGLDPTYEKELEDWGKQVVNTFLHDEGVKAEVGAKAGAWIAFFKAQLTSRREWKREEKQILEPRVQDLVGLLNRMAQDLKNKSGKQLLMVVDDLEKGESEAHRAMHTRIFQENYEVLVQPRFSIIYTLPIYFRALPGSRIPNDEMYAFSAVRIYARENKKEDRPPLSTEDPGYQLMRRFVAKRVADIQAIFDAEALDELLRIGGGLFRETARAIRDAAYRAIQRGAGRINMNDVQDVFDQIKKEYQPIIRGPAVRVLKSVLASDQGWVPDVEPFLQSRAVVEYENGDLWVDLRHVLKPYVRCLEDPDE